MFVFVVVFCGCLVVKDLLDVFVVWLELVSYFIIIEIEFHFKENNFSDLKKHSTD